MPSVPIVVDSGRHEGATFDIYSRLLQDRIIFLHGVVDDEASNLIVAQLLHLHAVNPSADIHFYINSPGGSVTAGMGMYDVINYIKCDVATYCLGIAASMGATLLAVGTKGKRYALPHAEVMIHQVLGGAQGTATEMLIRTKHLLRTKKKMNEILAKHTGQPLERVEKDTDRDNFMTAEEARDYGLVDHIIDKMP